MTNLDYQARVYAEKELLDMNLRKLETFLNSNVTLAGRPRVLLRMQRDAMNLYSQILSDRIELFSDER